MLELGTVIVDECISGLDVGIWVQLLWINIFQGRILELGTDTVD